MTAGTLRGLNALDINFEYPITAIAGKNGAGKSTILALASCAFHNSASGFKLPKRKNAYYTFSDFFIQHSAEISPQGLSIAYWMAYNNWKKSPTIPEGVGIAFQVRKKIRGGKWNDYDTRVPRTVAFLGIERIVPHSERSQSRSYSKVFKATQPKGWETKVMDAVGFVLGKTYDDFRYHEHSKYSLPIVECGGATYSGFNMGAGENALFEIFSTIYAAGDGALLVLDEVELGLHSEAQRKFMDKLKDVCLEMHTQVVCTTHSKEIFDCLPNDARFYIEAVNGKTRVTPGISSEFAFAKLSSITGLELEIYLEDEVAMAILQASLPASIRNRVTFTVIGSATALARQLAALNVRGERVPVLAVFDGDQQAKEADNLDHAKRMAERPKPDFQIWFKDHICYLPGDAWPEMWLLQKAYEVIDPLTVVLGTDADELKDILEYGLQAGKHNEFHELSKHLGLNEQICLQYFTSVICQHLPNEFIALSEKIESVLKKNS
ncbi:MAG: AAA family ATPase [Rhodoferax sp.]